MKRFVLLVLMVLLLISSVSSEVQTFALAEQEPFAQDYYVLTEAETKCITDRVNLELSLNPSYVWGAAGLELGAPGDCSGKLYAIFFT